MNRRISEKQEQAIRLCSGDFEGLTTEEAAVVMGITPRAVSYLLKRAEVACPQLFPLLSKQEAIVKDRIASGYTNLQVADELGVGLSRVSQIIGSINDKQGTVRLPLVKLIRYQPCLDSQVKEKF